MYRYRIEYVDERTSSLEVVTQFGIIAASNYTKAIKSLVHFYGGEQFVVSVNIYAINDIITDEEYSSMIMEEG